MSHKDTPPAQYEEDLLHLSSWRAFKTHDAESSNDSVAVSNGPTWPHSRGPIMPNQIDAILEAAILLQEMKSAADGSYGTIGEDGCAVSDAEAVRGYGGSPVSRPSPDAGDGRRVGAPTHATLERNQSYCKKFKRSQKDQLSLDVCNQENV